jgi:hypothetical protein
MNKGSTPINVGRVKSGNKQLDFAAQPHYPIEMEPIVEEPLQ